MNALISFINNVVGDPLNEQNRPQVICNYDNNYYGDQVCRFEFN